MKKLFILSAFIIGTLANVSAQNTDSLKNSISSIKIRGVKKPLYTIDGIKQTPYANFNISSLKPETIQEVKILKIDDAIKLYGVEAIDGAILITTKLGKNNASNLDLENKLALLDIDKNVSIVRDIRFTTKTIGKTDSIKPYHQSRIIFRGLNNDINNPKEPVYVLDGDKVEKRSINFLSPESIESVTILKKNDAAALYGAQALNGVVIITTKKPVPKFQQKATDKN